MESLQCLKFQFRQDRLSFTQDWIASKEEYTVNSLTLRDVNELISGRKAVELKELLEERRAVAMEEIEVASAIRF